MSVFADARTIYLALKDNATAEAAIRAELATLALSIATDPNASMTITSSTVNGQSFTASASITQRQRMQMLSLIVKMFDAEATPTSEAVAVF